MGEVKNLFYKDIDISHKVQNRIDSLVLFISKNEELSKEESLSKIRNTAVYEKLLDIYTFYWTMPNSSIVNEYLREKN